MYEDDYETNKKRLLDEYNKVKSIKSEISEFGENEKTGNQFVRVDVPAPKLEVMSNYLKLELEKNGQIITNVQKGGGGTTYITAHDKSGKYQPNTYRVGDHHGRGGIFKANVDFRTFDDIDNFFNEKPHLVKQKPQEMQKEDFYLNFQNAKNVKETFLKTSKAGNDIYRFEFDLEKKGFKYNNAANSEELAAKSEGKSQLPKTEPQMNADEIGSEKRPEGLAETTKGNSESQVTKKGLWKSEHPKDFNPEKIFQELMSEGKIEAKKELSNLIHEKIRELVDPELMEAMRNIGTENEWKISPELKDKLNKLLEYAVAKQEIEAKEGNFVKGTELPIDILTFDVESVKNREPVDPDVKHNIGFDIYGYQVKISYSGREYYYEGKRIYPHYNMAMGEMMGQAKYIVEIWDKKSEQYKAPGKYVKLNNIKIVQPKESPYWFAHVKGNNVMAEDFAKEKGYQEAAALSPYELKLRKATKEEVEKIGEQWKEEWD